LYCQVFGAARVSSIVVCGAEIATVARTASIAQFASCGRTRERSLASAFSSPLYVLKTAACRMLLRRHRLDAGLSQEDLAERARLSTVSISDAYRKGRRPAQRDAQAKQRHPGTISDT
jgi:hypothetical protein